MSPAPVNGAVEVPLTGCDAFFLALENLMSSGGQGKHIGLTILELGPEFDIGAFRNAVRRFSLSHPLLQARLERPWWFGVPVWRTPEVLSPDAVPVFEHALGTNCDAHCERLLQGGEGGLEIHIIPRGDGTTVVSRWSHLLFDGRGIELALQEIARLAANPTEAPRAIASWGMPFPPAGGLFNLWMGTRAFVRRHYEMKPPDFHSLGGATPQPGAAAFRVVRLTRAESALLLARAARLTGGIFQMPYFFAVAARAHAAVLKKRGHETGSFVSPVPVQARKPKARHPIFQNQVTVLHFKLAALDADSLERATASIHAQFEAAVRQGIDASSATMLWWMRRLPSTLYRRFLQSDTGGEIASFFHSHTGEFLSGTRQICGATIEDGWHIPSVSQPPGSGIFFSERDGRFTATISWREGSLRPGEEDTMEASLRGDFLGAGD